MPASWLSLSHYVVFVPLYLVCIYKTLFHLIGADHTDTRVSSLVFQLCCTRCFQFGTKSGFESGFWKRRRRSSDLHWRPKSTKRQTAWWHLCPFVRTSMLWGHIWTRVVFHVMHLSALQAVPISCLTLVKVTNYRFLKTIPTVLVFLKTKIIISVRFILKFKIPPREK